ncbi:hypothetical protein [Xanthomonas translucens]|uniref:Secreted protein n=3 Tax=Xanthomonas campestris pv. translucens TaxID=343 RepID=A0A120EYA0_XANCT|nr:hypothetical protein [Xanthomonas translucens]KWV15694.1 hypothetical protein ATB53_11245 [Xanthomonas translucens]QSQ32976.1 hypothetical protein ISN31_13900 [Xanthomonas translucens pv. translucens]UKE50491.1 hypothetical protein KCU57_17730 [Xanthomonas translucens]
MRLLSALWSCLLSLAGCQGHATLDLSTDAHRQTVVHASERGVAVIFSRTSYRGGLATFRCVDSRSGRCHYQVYAACAAPVAPAGSTAACVPHLLQEFDLQVGQRREVGGLPRDFGQCVAPETPAAAQPCMQG